MEAHIDNPSNHRFYWEGDLMDNKKVEERIQINIHFGDKDLNEIITELLDAKMLLWKLENLEAQKYNDDNYTTVNY